MTLSHFGNPLENPLVYAAQNDSTQESDGISFKQGFTLDLILLLLLLSFCAAGTWNSLKFGGGGPEDGVMLLRYSHNLAEHHGITWNVGQPPVEGATDFLYMVSIAGVSCLLHQDAAMACRELLFVCWLALAAVTFLSTRITLRANRWLALALTLYLISIGGSIYLQSFFGSPFMLLTVALAWWMGVAFISRRAPINWATSALFSILALLIGLTRPEGNFLAVLLLLSIVFLRGVRETKILILAFVAVFTLLGGSYFLWRWHYFGYLLPNPFYVKGGGNLHFEGLKVSIKNVTKILWPIIPVALMALRNRYRTRLLIGLLIPVAGYTLVWILLSPENNWLARFQMPILPVVLLFAPLLLEDIFSELNFPVVELNRRTQLSLGLAAAAYTIAVCVVFHKSFPHDPLTTSGKEFAQHLSKYADRGYTMAVTEAGQFPYFSRWNAIDALGLNDVTIAHHGINEAYLDLSKPELIMYHLYVPDVSQPGLLSRDNAAITRRDINAIKVLHRYAEDHQYILAAAYGSEPCSLNVFYVRPNTRDTDAIVDYIRNTPYYFLDTGILSVDYRDGIRPECHMPELGGR
jgi:arabinofuranosyltransferase